MQEKDEVIVNASGRGYWVYTCNERPQGIKGRLKGYLEGYLKGTFKRP